MFLTFPKVAITPDNRIDKLSENDLNLIRDTAIQNGGRKVQVQIRDSLYEVSNRPVEGNSIYSRLEQTETYPWRVILH